MKFSQISSKKAEDFRRLTGVKRSTFDKMIEILSVAEDERRKLGGRPAKVSLEDGLLMALEYLREYRTYFHIAGSYGLSESQCYRHICWIENTLIKSGAFSLPGKKALVKSDVEYEVVLVDATENPIQRPKKNRENTTLERRKSTVSKARSL